MTSIIARCLSLQVARQLANSRLYLSFAPTFVRSRRYIQVQRECLYSSEQTKKPEGSSRNRVEVGYDELVESLKEGNVQLIDVREPKEIEEEGKIPGSLNIPLTQLKAALELEAGDYQQKFHAPKPSPKGAKVVFYGHAEIKCAAALELAHKLGYKQARHYPGGYSEWKKKVVH